MPRLLAGGNPQIPKGDGDVVKAVKWDPPLYGVEGQGVFVSFRCFTRCIKLTFFAGAELDPVPPVDFTDPTEKAFHIHEDEALDVDQLRSWFEQAAAIPGWTP